LGVFRFIFSEAAPSVVAAAPQPPLKAYSRAHDKRHKHVVTQYDISTVRIVTQTDTCYYFYDQYISAFLNSLPTHPNINASVNNQIVKQ
jgi:hypothetical protein